LALATDGSIHFDQSRNGNSSYPVRAILPSIQIENLGSPIFCNRYGIRYPYLSGSMANGIASVPLVSAMSQAGMIGFFGAAGLSLSRVEAAIEELQSSLGNLPFGINLIHSPNEPQHEADLVVLLIKRKIQLIEASAFLDLTLPLIRYRLVGIRRDFDG
jgi:hypothetical protein